MSENLTGKYLDGAGLSKVWEKVKSYSSSNYLPLTGGSISGNLSTNGTLSVGNILKVYGSGRYAGKDIVLGRPALDEIDQPLVASAIQMYGVVTLGESLYGNDRFVNYGQTILKAQTTATSITLSSDITADNQATTKKYVDDKVSAATSSLNYLPLSGGTVTGPLTLTSPITANNQATTKKYVDDKVSTSLGNYLPLTGGTTDFLNSTKITVGNLGQLTGGENDGFDLYVIGSAYARSFSAMQVNLSGSITSNKQATTKKYVDDKVSTVTSSLGNYLPLTGGTLTGPLTLSGTDGNGIITTEGVIAKNGLFVGRDAGENTWPAMVGMNYEIGYFTGQATITSGLGDNEVNINIIPKAAGADGKGRIDISGPQITFNDIDQTNKGITFTPTLATFNVPTSATSITLSSAITQDTQVTTKKYVDDKVSTAISSLNEVLKFKGSINSTSALPTSAELGWVYVVSEAGTYAGETCEVGDMIICTTASTTAPTWTIIQRNIPGVMSNDEIDSICTY